jgi:putative tricarboxylic transport membrane protein
MEIVNGLFNGFQVVFQPYNLFFTFLGCLLGTLVGVLPGLGPGATMSLLLPATLKIPPVTAILMLAGIYYGAMYGGSTTSILVNIPGEAASVVTCLDGYQMARKGRAGAALGISAMGSFIAGTIGLVCLTIIAPPLAEMALKFGPPEYFALMLAGLTILSFLTSGPLWKTLLMAAFGLFISSIGMDNILGTTRFTFGIMELTDGVGFIPVVMGLFGVGEVFINLEQSMEQSVFETKITGILPTLKDWANSFWSILRGTFVGFFLGVLPGGGAIIASFVSYAIEKKVSKTPERFGQGAIEGVAAPESANNSAASGAFVPLLTLGIPANTVMAMLLGAFILHGVQPGPLLFKQHPEIFWGVIASMYLGNAMLLVLNLPLIPLWVKILKIPYRFLYPVILLIILIGSYSLNNSIVEVIIVIFFGIMGYFCRKFGFDLPPFILALVLGPMMENALRRSLLLSDGSPFIFVTRPISLVFIANALLILLFPLLPWFKKGRGQTSKIGDQI